MYGTHFQGLTCLAVEFVFTLRLKCKCMGMQ